MRTVSAREANQHFSRLLDAAVDGEEVVITRRGVPVVRMVRVDDSNDDTARESERERKLRMAKEWLAWPGISGGTQDTWTKDELYEREPWPEAPK